MIGPRVVAVLLLLSVACSGNADPAACEDWDHRAQLAATGEAIGTRGDADAVYAGYRAQGYFDVGGTRVRLPEGC